MNAHWSSNSGDDWHSWRVLPEEFNEARRKGDLARLFAFFRNRLPLFDEWLEAHGLDEELFLRPVGTGKWFIGDSERQLVKRQTGKKLEHLILPTQVGTIRGRQVSVAGDTEVLRFTSYLQWMRQQTGEERFVPVDRANKALSADLLINAWGAVDQPQRSNAFLCNEFELLKLGGCSLEPHSCVKGKNLDFANLDHLTVAGEHSTFSELEIVYSSCQHIMLKGIRSGFVRFYGCPIDELSIIDSYLQDYSFEKCIVGRPTFINSHLPGLTIRRTYIFYPSFDRVFLDRLDYEPRPGEDPEIVLDNYRRFRQPIQASGNWSMASEYYYKEKCAELTLLRDPYWPNRADFPQRTEWSSILGNLWAWCRRRLSTVKLLSRFGRHAGFYSKLVLNPVYWPRYARNRAKHLLSLMEYLVWGYGERPGRVLLMASLAIVLYATVYYFSGIDRAAKSMSGALYFSIVTFTTLGYGDITPVDPLERLVCATEALVGVVLLGLFVGALANRVRH